MLRLVPGSLREAAFALGAPRWKVSTMVTLRAAKSGVMTGLLLAVARISGETAPLLFTALNNQFFSTDMSEPMANLPVVIFQFALSPYDNWIRLAWGGALLITLSVLVLNIVARVFLREKTPGLSRSFHPYRTTPLPRTTMTETATPAKNALELRNLNFFYGKFQGLKDVNLDIDERKVTAFIGPSGCGKSTLLRTLNRMYSLYPGQRAEGDHQFLRPEHPGRRSRTSTCCAPASAWCSRSPRRSRCRSTTTSPSA